MLPKFFVYGDPNNKPRFSSQIIINSINNAAKKLGLYDENGLPVVYDCICNWHGREPAAIIACYELPYHDLIIQNAKNKPLFLVSRDSMRFAIDGGYNPNLCNFIHLGIDTEQWKPVQKNKNLDKFVILSYTESLVRSGLDVLVESVNQLKFKKDCLLYIKDRNATSQFEGWIKNKCEEYDINLKYENRHIDTIEGVREVFSEADCHVYLNRSTTWGMTVLESITCGLPTIAPLYSGPRDFITSGQNGLGCEFILTPVFQTIDSLINQGQRSFFFPLRKTDYWCQPSQSHVSYLISQLYIYKSLRDKVSSLGPIYSKAYSWERTALMLAEGLQKI